MNHNMVKERLFILSVIVTIVAIALSIVLAVTSSTHIEIGTMTILVTLVLTLGFTAFVAVRLDITSIDERRVGSLPLQRLPSVPEIEPAIVSIVENVADIKCRRSDRALMAQMAARRVQRAAEDIALIEDGVYICTNREELPCVRAALADTERQVRAVAARGMKWWDSADANAYWQAYEEAAGRLEITRVFLLQAGEDPDVLRRVIARHAKAGMKAYVLDAALVPAQHIKPIVIFDDYLVHKSADDREATDANFGVEFTNRAAAVALAEETFRVVFGLASDAGVVASGADVAR
jgi:hypothetical protein